MSFYKRTIKDVSVRNKTVLVRADYNVPLDEKGNIHDDLRVRASVPTLSYLLERQATVVVMSHLGRPDGKKDPSSSLRPVAARLEELLGREVIFVDDCKGDIAARAIKKAPKGSLVLLENVRFYPGEEENSRDFAKAIADAVKPDLFVQDGFGVVHRAHATTDAITEFAPSVAGLLLEKEYVKITSAMEKPRRPLVAVLGGAKVSDKIKVIERFVAIADKIIIGGAMANTFLAYKGHHMGSSLCEPGQEAILDRIYTAAEKKVSGSVEDFIILPSDVAVAPKPVEGAARHMVKLGDVAKGDMALDIGDQSIEQMIDAVKGAGTVIWNGPLGYSTIEAFAHGSARLALALATQPETDSIIGGGDTADFVLGWGNGTGDEFSHVSTGGGASLDLMSGLKLPGVESLLDA